MADSGVPSLPDPRLSDEQIDAIDRRMDERRLLQQWPPLMEWDVAALVAEIRAGRERETALAAENEKLRAKNDRQASRIAVHQARETALRAAFQEFVDAVSPWIKAVLYDHSDAHPLVSAIERALGVLNDN